MNPAPASPRRLPEVEYRLLGVILLLGLIHGTIYVFIMPPWQHFDEPTHFEHVWLRAAGYPIEPDGFQTDFRIALVRSMIEHDFYRGLEAPDPEQAGPGTLGLQFPQLDEPPLYYSLASLPVRFSGSPDLAVQLRAARTVSVWLLLVSLLAAWGVMREVTPPGSPWRFLVPMTMALLPGYVELMTAVNNDVGAAAVFSLFLWACAVVLARGFSPLRAGAVLVCTVLAALTKSTALLAVPLSLAALGISLAPAPRRRTAWLTLGALALAGLFALLDGQGAAYWYKSNSQQIPLRVEHPAAPAGPHALQLDPAAAVTPRWLRPLYQPLPSGTGEALRGQTVTFGVWMWAQSSAADGTAVAGLPIASSPILNVDEQAYSLEFRLSETPQFVVYQASMPPTANRLWLTLSPLPRNPAHQVTVFYDGFILAAGSYPTGELPIFTDSAGQGGLWGGQPFANLLRNPMIESVWPGVRPWADNLGARILPDNTRPSMIVSAVLDPQASGWYFSAASRNLLHSFWATFGWGHVRLPGAFTYATLVLVTLIGLGSAVLLPVRRNIWTAKDAAAFLGLALLGVWGAAWLRGVIYIFVAHVFYPSARYAYPAIIPTLGLLVSGWISGIGRAAVMFVRPAAVTFVIYFSWFVLLDLFSIWTIVNFYA